MDQAITIDDLDELSVRAYNSLKRADITTLEQIRKLSDDEIRTLPYANRKMFAEIKGLIGGQQEKELLKYECDECGAEYETTDQDLFYCDSDECADKGVKLHRAHEL